MSNESPMLGALLLLLICAFGIIQWIRGWRARDRENPIEAVKRRHPAWFAPGASAEDWDSTEDAAYDHLDKELPDAPRL